MVPDFEVLKVLTEILDKLDIGDYEVYISPTMLFLDTISLYGCLLSHMVQAPSGSNLKSFSFTKVFPY
jgi:histidyl-tRNA synthetase